ncbi:MAG: NAD(P)/FAD-dependent oxidoreductase [Halofilum sp. (in: g-proteobacteria)]
MTNTPHRIVIVGGGSGGLKLATWLGDRYRDDATVEITLIDGTLTHVWKPLLHEIAAGTLDVHDDEREYMAHGRAHHFRFTWGRMEGLDRSARQVWLEPLREDSGNDALPRRAVPYDTLVIAVGSVSNDFGVPGVAEHCYTLDSVAEAERFRRQLLEAYLRAEQRAGALDPGELDVAVVGAGATGVELAAELDRMRRQLTAYGVRKLDPERDSRLVLVEQAPRVLPGLADDLAAATRAQLERLGVELHTGEAVSQARADGLRLSSDTFIPARFLVWAAGVKAPAFLQQIDGLETDRGNRLMVGSTLQTTRDERIFALGDCAACPPKPGSERTVPPRAQAADQQAAFLARSLACRRAGKPLPRFEYHDRGALVNVHDSAFGTLMGSLLGQVTIKGWFARLGYRSLYRAHQRALHGSLRAALLWLTDILTRRTRPRLKLH